MSGKKILFLLIIVVLVAGAITFIVYRMEPENVVEGALNNLAEADTKAFEAKISVSNPQASVDMLGEEAAIELDIDGRYKRMEEQRDSVDASIGFTTKTETLTMLAEGKARFIDDKAYFKVTKSPAIFPILAQLKGQWIEMTRGEKQEKADFEFEDEPLVNVEAGGKREVGGVSVRVYEAEATSAAVINMLDGVASVLGTRLTEDQIKGIRERVEGTKNVPVELAVDPWTRELKQIRSTTVIPDNNNTIDIEFTFSDIEDPVEIMAPENAQSLLGETDAIGGQEDERREKDVD